MCMENYQTSTIEQTICRRPNCALGMFLILLLPCIYFFVLVIPVRGRLISCHSCLCTVYHCRSCMCIVCSSHRCTCTVCPCHSCMCTVCSCHPCTCTVCFIAPVYMYAKFLTDHVYMRKACYTPMTSRHLRLRHHRSSVGSLYAESKPYLTLRNTGPY